MTQSRSDSGVYTGLPSASLTSRDFCQISCSQRSTTPSWFCRPFTAKKPQKSGQDVECRTAHAHSDIHHLVRLHPDTPHQCVSAQCGFRFSSASSSIRSLRSVIDLRRAVSPLACCRCSRCCSFRDESSDSPSNALRSSQTHETGFKCPSGHGRREKRLQRLSGGQARRYP